MTFQGFAHQWMLPGAGQILGIPICISQCELSAGRRKTLPRNLGTSISSFRAFKQVYGFIKTIPIKHIKANEVDSLVSVKTRWFGKAFYRFVGSKTKPDCAVR